MEIPASKLEYAPPSRRRSRWPTVMQFFIDCYPLLFLGLLYTEWSFHRYMPVRFSSIRNTPLHYVTGVALAALIPIGLAAISLNIAYILEARRDGPSMITRWTLTIAAWIGTFFLLAVDPGHVLYWWLD